MINIVLYGKPRGFESHEYGFDIDNTTAVDNSFPEPLLKPKNFQEPVLHYFSREGYSGIEYYTRAKGYESERDGIVFGIALKTDHDFDLTKVVNDILSRYWSDFASVLLNEVERFSYPTILKILNGTKWGGEDISIIQKSIEQAPLNNPSKNLCLLYAPEFDQIHAVEAQLKQYSDVYISANLDIFNDSINSVVLNLTGGKIHTIKDGAIVEIQKGSTSSSSTRRKNTPQWGGKEGKDEPKNTAITNNNNQEKDNGYGNGDGGDGYGNGNGEGKKKKWITIASIAVIAIIALFLVLHKSNPSNSGKSLKNGTTTNAGGTAQPGNTDEHVTVYFNQYYKPINESLNLKPMLIKEQNSSIVLSDITFSVDHSEIVEIKTENQIYILSVKQRPKIETNVTVTANYQGNIIGSARYKIAKEESNSKSGTTTGTSTSNSPKYSIPISIHYMDGHTERTTHKKGEHETATATDKNGNILQDGNWRLIGGSDFRCDNLQKNPITVWAEKQGDYQLEYSITINERKESATANFKVIP